MPRSRPMREPGGYPSPGEMGPPKSKRAGKAKGAPAEPEDDDDEELSALGVPLDSVVKVWCVHSTPNFSLPWQRRRQERSSGSGFCIDKARRVIMTNAHCIEWHAQVRVQRRGDDTKYLAKVLSVGWECDAAVLTVEDDEFWTEMQSVTLSQKIPHLEEHVLCVGFPVGGDTISVTSGVISRVETTTYTQASAELLGIQIDAAINSGNSGGPAFNDAGECVGVAFQSMGADEAENIGYVIPTLVVMHFLNDLLKNGKYTGFPTLGVEIQTMENAHLREAFGMDAKQKGVLVSRIAPTASAASILKVKDVLLAFDSEPIGNDGTVRFRRHERVAFNWLVSQKYYGEPAKFTVLRDGKKLELDMERLQPEAQLVPVHLFDTPHQCPSYVIFAGLVFTAVTVPFLRSEFGEEWDCEAPVEMVKSVNDRRADFDGQQLVVLTQVLANDLTMGYEFLENMLLNTVNSVPLRNLDHLRQLISTCDNKGFLRLGLQNNLMLILKAEEARKVTEKVLDKYGIPSAMSRDLVDEPRPEGDANGEEGCA